MQDSKLDALSSNPSSVAQLLHDVGHLLNFSVLEFSPLPMG